MALEGLHHITAITGDAPRNLDFYARALGLRLVQKTVTFDQPDVYHLYYGDERATPGAILTFFEFPGATPGRHGEGMPYRIAWRVAGDGALDFWSKRLGDERIACASAEDGSLRFSDPEGLEPDLVVEDVADAPLAAAAGDIPAESAAGDAELERYREIAAAAGARPTPIIDRQYFHSVYFREPSGVLFELASRDVGFDVDEPLQSLGEALMLPPQHASRREQLEKRLTPITNPRQAT